MRGGSVPIIYNESNFRDLYLDEYTGEILPRYLLDAILDELDDFNDRRWEVSTREDMMKVDGDSTPTSLSGAGGSIATKAMH